MDNSINNNNKTSFLQLWSVRRNFNALFDRGPGSYHVLDGLRAVGYLVVLITHTVFVYGLRGGEERMIQLFDHTPYALYWIWNGDKAVDMFFVISGFLISLILFKELSKTGSLQFKRFYFRRYLRLTPVYAVILFIYWCFGLKNHEWVWANILYVNNYIPLENIVMPWTWSLAVEEQFYLLLPIVLVLIYKQARLSPLTALISLLVLSIIIRFVVVFGNDVLWNTGYRDLVVSKDVVPIFYGKLYYSLLTRYGPFVCGVLVAYGYFFHRQAIESWLRASSQRARMLDFLALAMIVFLMLFPILDSRFEASSPGLVFYIVCHRILFAMACGWLLLGCVMNTISIQWLARFFSWRGWQPFSQLTYSMYIVHFYVAVGAVHVMAKRYIIPLGLPPAETAYLTILGGFFLALIITALLGVFCWVFIEKPFLNMRELFAINKGATHAATEKPPVPGADRSVIG